MRGCRPKISPPMKRWVMARDGHRCRMCGVQTWTPARDGEKWVISLGVYHDRSWRHGWPSLASNLVTLCRSCGAKRSGKSGEQPPVAGVTWST